MSYVKPPEDAKVALQHEIDAAQRSITDHENRIRHEEERIEALVKLLFYCTCEKCGAELAGGIQNAQDMMEASKAVGRHDAPCVFCDTPEQTAAMEKVLASI